ncbi:MAG: methyltransferase domain-containing protein [Myxococcota bacterium]
MTAHDTTRGDREKQLTVVDDRLVCEPGEQRAKPLVVLVPDVSVWVLGAWAREIAEHNADRYDFVIFPFEEIRSRPEVFAEIAAAADCVHALSPLCFDAVRRRVRAAGGDEVTLIASLHHIVRFEDVRPCLAADRIAVMCQEVREELVSRGVPDRKLFLLRKGIDSSFFRPRNRRAARARIGLPDDDFVIGFSAKASSDDDGRKGLDVLIDAVSRLADTAGPPVRLALSGPGWDLEGAEDFPPNVDVDYFPFLEPDAMPDFYSAIDVYVSTARVEGGPIPPFEALSCGTPVVSTPVGAIRDLVTDEVDGLLVPVGDARRTAEAVHALRCDPDLARSLGRAGREAVVRDLGCRDAALRAQALYGTVVVRQRLAGRNAPTVAELSRLSDELVASDSAHWTERLRRLRRPDRRGRVGWPGSLQRAAQPIAWAWRRLGLPNREVAHVDLATLGVRDDSRVLDLGCGNGPLSRPLFERGYRATAIDLDASRLGELASTLREQRTPGDLVRADGAALPCANACFDAVVCREMLEHIESPGAVLDEISRVLAPDGRLCVTTPSAHTERYFQWVDPSWLAMAGHVHVFSRADMRALLEAQGFRVVEIRGRDCFYSFFWFVHTLVKTRHDGTGRILEHYRLARRVFRAWDLLREGRFKRALEAVGNRLVPKSDVYYCERAPVRSSR